MTLKFSANISTMFKEVDLVDRFNMARECGFSAVEIQDPYIVDAGILGEKRKGMICDLVNLCYDAETTPYGCLSLPHKVDDFFRTTSKVLKYHHALNFKKLHILSGLKSKDFSEEDQKLTMINSLKTLSEDYLDNMNVTAVIEPICKEVVKDYFLDNYETAVEIIKAVDSSQVKLLLDIFHLHKITGSVPEFLKVYYPYAGHIQISQDPGRIEPFGSVGNIDYVYVFNFLKEKNHSDYIGLEYYPSGSTADSIKWMKNYL